MDFDTATVIKRHLDALMSRDLDRLMEDYAEDAFFLSNMAPYGDEATTNGIGGVFGVSFNS